MALQDYNHSTNLGDSYWISVWKMKYTQAKMIEKQGATMFFQRPKL